MLRDNILATDLANHFKCLDDQMKMAEVSEISFLSYSKPTLHTKLQLNKFNTKSILFQQEGLDITIPYQKSLLMDLLMTCSDLSDQTKVTITNNVLTKETVLTMN